MKVPAAVRVAIALNKCSPDRDGFVFVARPNLFRVRRVAAENMNRAARIVQALLTAAAYRGIKVMTGDKGLALVVNGEPIELFIKEWSTLKKEKLPRSTPDPLGNTGPRWSYHYSSTGRFSIEIDAGYSSLRVRRRWMDNASRKVESMLDDVLAGLVAYAAARKHERARAAIQEREQKLHLEREEQERKLQRQREEEERKRAELERRRVEFLAQRLRAVDEAQQIDRFLAMLKAYTPRDRQASPQYQAFVQWAELRSERLRRAYIADHLESVLADGSLFPD